MSERLQGVLVGMLISGLLLIGWATYENTHAWHGPAAAPPAGTPLPPTVPVVRPPDATFPSLPGSAPEKPIRNLKGKVTLNSGQDAWINLPLGGAENRIEVDVNPLAMSSVDLARFLDSPDLVSGVYSPAQFNQLKEYRLGKTDPPKPTGRLTKKGQGFHWDGGDANSGDWVLRLKNAAKYTLNLNYALTPKSVH